MACRRVGNVGNLLRVTLVTLLLGACQMTSEWEEPQPNQSPDRFTVTSANISLNSALFTWPAIVDPDGDPVTYSLSLNDLELQRGWPENRFLLTNLEASTTYIFKVVAEDGKGGTSLAGIMFTTKEADAPSLVLNPAFFDPSVSMQIKQVDCELENGAMSACFELSFYSNPVLGGPFCPTKTNEIGGITIYDGPTNPGLKLLSSSFFDDMMNDGFNIADSEGNVRINAYASDHENQCFCLESPVQNDLVLKFRIPVIPQISEELSYIGTEELMGVSTMGIPIVGEPITQASNYWGEGSFSALDPCGGHYDVMGYYHLHFIPGAMNNMLQKNEITEIVCNTMPHNPSGLNGYAKDGYPIYGPFDSGGVVPSQLDACHGHFGKTPEFPEGMYHYHATEEAYNLPPCLKGVSAKKTFEISAVK